MKIAFLANGYPPCSVAGTEVSTAAVAAELSAAGHHVTVICAGRWDSGPEPLNGRHTSEQDGVTVVRLDLNWQRGPDPNLYLYDNPATAAAVAELVDRLRPDVVHATSCYALSGSVLREVEERGLPLVVTLTDYWFLCPRVTLLRSDGTRCSGMTTASECVDCMLGDSPAYRKVRARVPSSVLSHLTSPVARRPELSRRRGFRGRALDFRARKRVLSSLLAAADEVLAPTRALADRHVALIPRRRPIRLWRFGHDLRWTEQLERRTDDGRLVFGFVGRIAEEKGLHVLLEAVGRLGESAVEVELHVWGDLEQEPPYAERCRLLLQREAAVRFCGPFGRDRLAEVYGGIDVLVVPSIWDENSPLVVHEAFAAGVPVIVSDVPGLTEAVTAGADGLVFPPGDSVALGSAMRRLSGEPELLDALRAGIRPVRSAADAAADLLEVYGGLIDRDP